MRRHATLIQQTCRGENESAGANRCHTPYSRRNRTHPFDQARIRASLLNVHAAARNDQSVESVADIIESMGWSNLDSALGSDRAGRGGDEHTLVPGLTPASKPWQPRVSVEEYIVRTAHIENFAAGVDKKANPAGIGELLR